MERTHRENTWREHRDGKDITYGENTWGEHRDGKGADMGRTHGENIEMTKERTHGENIEMTKGEHTLFT